MIYVTKGAIDMPFSRHTRRSMFSIGAASLAAAFLFLTPENTHAADTTAKIHILTLDSGSNAIVLESVDDNGQKIFGMVDSGEDWDYPDGSDPRYPLRSGITTSTGYDDEVLSYLDSLGVTSDNLQFYVATHPHSDHIGTGDTIVRLYSPDRVYLLPYDDSYIYNTARLWDNLYVYDQLLTAAEETEGVTLIQHLNPGAASAEEGSPDFAFGNFQIQIVNYEEDYLTSPKEDANQFCLGVIASANDHRAFLTSDIDDVEGDASRIVSNYGLYSIDLMTSNHHGYPNAVDADYLAAVNPEYFIDHGLILSPFGESFLTMIHRPLWGCAYFPRQNIPAIFRQSLLTFPVPRSLPTWMIPMKFTATVLPSSLLIMTASRTADFSPAADRNIMQTAAIFSCAPLPGATQKRASNIPLMKTA